ncbi:pilus assembly PilX family protein [Coralloluteibacterium stylophorae]|uniref:Pilus assembly protein n=1 Tax=Coralloluteibacterium stylophorae TaxID=1776034 RepID=A0A8J8AY47_9GAMM|nr:PilX N-terminal domain-containing pilus assembly protein [Coralloluteibacterium stylophorae]MBS7458012.1 pilus assembly protein [Coralloluteibacterium stylophorae]
MSRPAPVPDTARGVALITVLILLLVMTLLGLTVLRTTLLQERMASNLVDRSVAFQATEAALREGEALAAGRPTVPESGCAQGVCAAPRPGDADRWLSPGFGGWRAAGAAADGAPAPQFIVEYMGDAPTWPGCDRMAPLPALCLAPRYRVTARSHDPGTVDAGARAEVLLQTNYVVE